MTSVSLGAILATLPLTAYYFNIIPLAGLPATVFASLALPHVMIVSSLTALAGLIFTPLAQLFGWVDWLFLSYTIIAVKAFSSWPYFSITANGLPLPFIVSYYVILTGAVCYFATRDSAEEALLNFIRGLNIFSSKLQEQVAGFKNYILAGLLLANL